MKAIDTKSFMIGLLFGICLFLALGAAGGGREEVGGYQIACPDAQNTCFVVDTTTGRVWKRYSGSSGEGYGSPADWNAKILNVPTRPR